MTVSQTGDSLVRPAWASGRIDFEFDATSAIDSGCDPREQILALAERVPVGGVLAVSSPFDPRPLRRLLGRMGFASFASRQDGGGWRVLFRRDGEGEPEPVPGPDSCSDEEMDLRNLEPPAPMVAILGRIEKGLGGTGFSVLLERDPLFLYPELADRGWSWRRLPADGEDVRLRLFPETES